MSLDGISQRIPKDITGGDGFPVIEVSCGSTIYDGPASSGFRKCQLNHMHCHNCGGVARKYGRTYSCINNCKEVL